MIVGRTDVVVQAKSQTVFDKAHEARAGYIEALQKHDRFLSARLQNSLTPHDVFLCALNKAIVIIRDFTQMDLAERKQKLKSSITKPNWPEEPFDRFRKIKDWDDVFRIADGLYQAQLCVSLFPPAGNIYHGVIAIATIAAQIALGEAPKNIPSLEVEMSHHLPVNRDGITARVPEINKLIVAWSSSIPEAGLPIPTLKPPKRSSMIGQGVAGWGSDKRRPVPVSAIVTRAGRTIAENWAAIKRARLKRPAVIPYEEEIALSRKMFSGGVVTSERHALLRKYAIADDVFRTPSRSASPQKSESSSGRRRDSQTDPGQPEPRTDKPSTAHRGQQPVTTPQHKLDEVREWIEKGDDSSDDDGQSVSTDDDTPRPREKRPRLFDPHQEIGELPRPFAFSIGPTGFGIDRTAADSSSSAVASSSPGPGGDPTKPLSRSQDRINGRGQSVESGPSDGQASASGSRRMTRESSSTSSLGSASASASGSSTPVSTPHWSSQRSTPLRSLESPEPSSVSEVSAYSRASELRAVKRGLDNDDDHIGVLKRERSQYVRSKQPRERPEPLIKTMPEPMVIKAIILWLDSQIASGSIPKVMTPEYLSKFGLKNGRLPTDLHTYLSSQAIYRSPLETLLRIGVQPMNIPPHLLPFSVSAAHLNLYHYHQRDEILGQATVNETPKLAETSLRLFFRGFGNDTLAETFIKEDSMELIERADQIYRQGDWDDLEDPSPVKKATFRKRKRPDYANMEPSNMIQRIAREIGDRGPDNQMTPDAETEMIQKAVMASLMYVQQRPPVDQYKTTATVPRLWYNDGLTELHLVPQTKISIAASKDYTDRIWSEWKDQEARGHIHMPHPLGQGEVLLKRRGLVVNDEGIITRPK